MPERGEALTAFEGTAISDQKALRLPEEMYVLHSRNSNRPLPDPARARRHSAHPVRDSAHQGRRDIFAAEHGIDTPSLILLVVICCVCLLTALWAASSGWDLSAYLL